MPKKDTAAEIQAANGVTVDPTQYTQKELDTLLASAADSAEFDRLKAEYDNDGTAVNDNTPEPGAFVTYTHEDGKEYQGRVIRVNDAATGDLALQVDALGAEARQMTVLADKWKLA